MKLPLSSRAASCALGALLLASSLVLSAAEPAPPKGFRALFNAKDLAGWYGWNPHSSVKLKDEKLAANLKQQREDFSKHWRVDGGELVNAGTGPYATTDAEFGDIELLIEYKTVPKADSGIYLRGRYELQVLDDNYEKATNSKIDPRQAHGSASGHEYGGLFDFDFHCLLPDAANGARRACPITVCDSFQV